MTMRTRRAFSLVEVLIAGAMFAVGTTGILSAWVTLNGIIDTQRRSADAVVVAGHWSALGLRLAPNLLALDTGYLWGGQLTALRLEDRALFQIPAPPGRPQR